MIKRVRIRRDKKTTHNEVISKMRLLSLIDTMGK